MTNQLVSKAGKATKKAKLKPPTPTQQARVTSSGLGIQFEADEELAAALATNGVYEQGPSDVTLFNLFSIVSPDNALALASAGIEDPDSARELLELRRLSHLLLDRRELMEIAVSMRVKPIHMLTLSRKYSPDDYAPEVFATAAALAGNVKEIPLNRGTPDEVRLCDSLLTGVIPFEDIQELTTTYLRRESHYTERVHRALLARNVEGLGYSIALIKHVNKYTRFYGTYGDGLKLATTYGEKLVLSLKGIDGALAVEREYADRPVEYRRELIMYQEVALATDGDYQHGEIPGLSDLYDRQIPPEYINPIEKAFGMYSPKFSINEIGDAYEAGVPSDLLIPLLSDNGMTIDQIISAHKEGISNAVVHGWL